MASTELMPHLQLASLERIRPHEHPEHHRTLRLLKRIQAEMVLRNPPIVAEMEGGEFLLLDGANRVGSLRKLKFSHIPVQVVDYRDKEVELKGWHHLLVNGGTLGLRAAYEAISGTRMHQVATDELTGLLDSRSVYAVLVDETATCWAIAPDPSNREIPIRQRIAVLEQVVGGYEGQGKLERVKLADFSQLPEVVRNVRHQLCLFPIFAKEELLELAAEGTLIPTGISRHLIPGRALGLNFDLALIAGEQPPTEKERAFEDYVAHLEIAGRVRFYEESVFVMNE